MHITNYHAHIVFSPPGYKAKSHAEYYIDGSFIATSCNWPENRWKEKNQLNFYIRFGKKQMFQFGKSKM